MSVTIVLIPLLVDDPLWEFFKHEKINLFPVLIPLLVDDPLWVDFFSFRYGKAKVLIPLLVDDPLWGFKICSVENW